MSDYIFLFDMDSTITRKEVLPEIAKRIGREKEMREITEQTMRGIIPFKQSFMSRIEILKDVSVEEVNRLVSEIPLNEHIVDFIQQNRERCFIVTGNLDIWISGLMKNLGMKGHYYCSKALKQNDRVEKVISVLDKELTVQQFVQPIVAIGDGNNDADMARLAQIAVGYGGVRDIAPALLRNIDYGFTDDKRCADFLKHLL